MAKVIRVINKIQRQDLENFKDLPYAYAFHLKAKWILSGNGESMVSAPHLIEMLGKKESDRLLAIANNGDVNSWQMVDPPALWLESAEKPW